MTIIEVKNLKLKIVEKLYYHVIPKDEVRGISFRFFMGQYEISPSLFAFARNDSEVAFARNDSEPLPSPYAGKVAEAVRLRSDEGP